MDIRTYATWKKNNNPEIWSVRDGVKGWAVQTVCPTIEHYGWKQCVMDADYGITEGTTPKKLAIRLLTEIHGDKWIEGKKFVYYVYHGTNGYMDVIYVWYKDENEPDMDMEFHEKKYEINL